MFSSYIYICAQHPFIAPHSDPRGEASERIDARAFVTGPVTSTSLILHEVCLMNMYTQLCLLTFPSNPDQTGEEHMWSFLQPRQPPRGIISRGLKRGHQSGDGLGIDTLGPHVVSLPQLLRWAAHSSSRVTLIIRCLLNANKHSAGNKLFTTVLFAERFILHQFIPKHLSQHLSRAAWNWMLVMMSIL